MKTAASLGLPRELARALDPRALCFVDAKFFPGVAGLVALTIDDAPCHQQEPGKSMLNEVRERATCCINCLQKLYPILINLLVVRPRDREIRDQRVHVTLGSYSEQSNDIK